MNQKITLIMVLMFQDSMNSSAGSLAREICEIQSIEGHPSFINRGLLPSFITEEKLKESCKSQSTVLVDLIVNTCQFAAIFLPLNLSEDILLDYFYKLLAKCRACSNHKCNDDFHTLNTLKIGLGLLQVIYKLGFPESFTTALCRRCAELIDDRKCQFDTLAIHLQQKIAAYFYLINGRPWDQKAAIPTGVSIKELLKFKTLDKKECYTDESDHFLSFLNQTARVKRLNLSKKHISDLTGWEELLMEWQVEKDKIQVLNLSDNHITVLPPSLLTGFAHLKKLYLDGNNLSSLPINLLDACPELEVFVLARNKLNRVDQGLLKSPSLRIFNICDNPLTHLPQEIFLSKQLEIFVSVEIDCFLLIENEHERLGRPLDVTTIAKLIYGLDKGPKIYYVSQDPEGDSVYNMGLNGDGLPYIYRSVRYS